VDDVIRHMTGEDAYPMPALGKRRRRGPKAPTTSRGANAGVQPDSPSALFAKPSLRAGPTSRPVAQEPAPAAPEVAPGDPDIATGDAPGMVELRVPLRGKVTRDWLWCFSTVSSSKEGSLNLVMSDPRVRDAMVMWQVEERDVESAMRHITRRITSANMLLAQERVKHAERERQAQAEEERTRAHLHKLERRVRENDERSS
jgi:hypothetical protein